MYEVIKKVINNKTYALTDMLVKIDTSWIKGYITEEQKDELIELARENADPTVELNVIQKLKDLDERVTTLENASEVEDPDTPDPPIVSDDYPEYVVGKWYYKDDKITFNQKKYICIAPTGVVCTWSPAEYPSYWSEVEA